MGLGATELLIIGLIIILLFGGRRLAEIGKGMGQAISQFRHGLKDGKDAGGSVDAEVKGAVKEGGASLRVVESERSA